MRINIYSQELTGEVLLVSKVADTGIEYWGVRHYLASPDILHFTPDDDDRSAITYWIPNATSFSKEDLAQMLENMATAVRGAPDPIASTSDHDEPRPGFGGMDDQALRDNGIRG